VRRPVDHVIWDWNGTLYDDSHVVVAAVNDVLAHHGLPSIDADYYRTHYQRPVHRFYEAMIGRPLLDEDWQLLDQLFHDGYAGRIPQIALTADAELVLRRVADTGATQSVLSMWRHDGLFPVVHAIGVADYFVEIDGLKGAAGGSKSEKMAEHLQRLAETVGVLPDSVVMIGDALDDAVAAESAGVRCVLYNGGSHHRPALEAVGVPVADTLVDALDLALGS
jgi:phosphoglycolate phosphatase-like HAD superfamily hydrolase